jgi:hypothetical protein
VLSKPQLSQVEAMGVFRSLDSSSRNRMLSWLIETANLPKEPLTIRRWAQAAVSMLPESRSLVSAAVSSVDADLQFSTLCALLDSNREEIGDELLSWALQNPSLQEYDDIKYIRARVAETFGTQVSLAEEN